MRNRETERKTKKIARPSRSKLKTLQKAWHEMVGLGLGEDPSLKGGFGPEAGKDSRTRGSPHHADELKSFLGFRSSPQQILQICVRDFSSIKLRSSSTLSLLLMVVAVDFASRCRPDLHASRPMWLKPRPPSHPEST
jgi:hypothetical protein